MAFLKMCIAFYAVLSVSAANAQSDTAPSGNNRSEVNTGNQTNQTATNGGVITRDGNVDNSKGKIIDNRRIEQKTYGDNSPAIQSGRDTNYNDQQRR
jgi:hypothetical protein